MSKRISQQPSPYPSFVFHAIRVGQVISSAIVVGILGFFIHYLTIEYFQIPWTFILLLAVSCFTLLFIVVSTYFYHRRIIRPGLSAIINLVLVVQWAAGSSLLTWFLSPLLGSECSIAIWNDSAAVMVCQLYKSLTAFAIIGFICTLLGLALDIYTLRSSKSRGAYNPMQDLKIPRNHAGSTENLNFREPSLEFPEYSHEVKQPYKAQRPIESQQFGSYGAPAEQTSYDGAGGASHLGGGGHTYAGDGYGGA